MIHTRLLMFGLLSIVATGCASSRPEIRMAESVDLDRFMGDWYVIASIPTFLEEGAHNPVETYELDDDGTIATTFRFLDGGFDGEEKVYTPRGFIRDRESNAEWGMRFVWPVKADYRVVYVSDDYSSTIIGRQKRDFVWIMARTPTIPDAEYDELVKIVEEEGYDLDELVRAPHRWPEESE